MPDLRNLIRLGLLTLSVTAFGCARAAPSWRLPSGQRCVSIESDAPAADLTTLLESGRIAISSPTFHFDTLLIFAAYDSTGARSTVQLFDRPGRPAVPEEVTAEVRSGFRPSADPGTRGYALLVQDPPGLLPHRSAFECPPRLLNETEVARLLRELSTSSAALDRTAMVVVQVDGEGRALRGEVRRSTGDFQLDRAMLDAALRGRFAPALRDGFAIPVWVGLPLTLRRATAVEALAPDRR